MGNYKEDTDQGFRTIFFLILFSLLVLASSDNKGNHSTSSTRFAAQNELVTGDVSSQDKAILCNAVCPSDLQKFRECALHNTSLNPFSIQNKISEYNRKVVLNLILLQKTRFSIDPVFPLWLYSHLHSDEDDNLPVLS